ncbi:MAG: anthranilate synthase component I family protein, partial [Thermaurantiacus sp.]
QEGRGDFLLESVEGGRVRGRYSFLGLAPDRLLEVRGTACRRGTPGPSGIAWEPLALAPLDAIRAERAAIALDVPPGVPASLPLLVGHFGYGSVRLVERLPEPRADPLDLPDMLFVRPTLVLVFDRLTDDLFLVAPDFAGVGEAEVTDRLEAAAARLAQPAPTPPPPRPATHPCEPEAVVPAADYLAMVARARDYIGAGDIFQVVLAQRFTAPFTPPPFQLYRALRRINPSPFLYHLDLPGHAVVGSSPEILVRVRDGEVIVRPIAGTRPRGATEAEDQALAAGLLADPKERAEHLMLLDLGRNDVGRVAAGGTVAVAEAFTIERYSHVMHIVSSVTGRLAPGRDALDALFAGFPAGTVSGAPKVRAMEIIAELEPEARGIYAGGVGYFAPDGAMDSCIVLRTAVVKDGVMHVTAGAGIVADSVPEAELAECRAKAGALFAAARAATGAAAMPGFGQ